MSDAKSAYEKDQPQNSGGLFLKTESGKVYRLRVLDLPVVYFSEYEDKATRKKTTRTQYAWPVYNHDAEEVQILQKGAQVYKELLALVQDDEWGDPVKYDIKLTHSGTGMETKYSVQPSPKSLDMPEIKEMPDVVAVLSASPNNHDVRKIGEEAHTKDTVLEDIDDAPINLDDIPFD